ncbi:MAG: hypothetical protein COV44_09785 [Deltaproteobacteria bacterium CG11_big_fil_rev_8_21_14_0_20_45_16]|nr:MAG: hypothetical protein COV44_09785 [Deltaproteobacteria bacterium CG11_big_fil_rev_8_21_14_0_20_45_16]
MTVSSELAIIGGGISGCSLAYEMAEAGWRVHLVEKHNELAFEASGNPLGVVMPVMTAEKTKISELSLRGSIYSAQKARKLLGWRPQGVLQLFHPQIKISKFSKGILNDVIPSRYFQKLSPPETSKVANIRLDFESILYPEAGALAPREFCHALVASSSISRHMGHEAIQIRRGENSWKIFDSAQKLIVESEHLILANAYHAKDLVGEELGMINRVRGQSCQLEPNEISRDLRSVICSDIYFSPAQDLHSLGGSYDRQAQDSVIKEGDNKKLVEKLSEFFPSAKELKLVSARSAFRCTSPDHLPLVGSSRRHQNLYYFLCMGSRALSYAPYLASKLKDQICLRNLTEDDRMIMDWVNPNRFPSILTRPEAAQV